MRAAATGRCPALASNSTRQATEQVFDHDKDGKPIPLYNPLTGKHDIKFTAKKLFLPHADAGEHLGDGTLPAQQLGRDLQRRPVVGRPHGRV